MGYKQGLLPLASQGEFLARENTRLLNCWLGIRYSDNLGEVFCDGCEYLEQCNGLYRFFSGARRRHPAALARKILTAFEIESDYLTKEE